MLNHVKSTRQRGDTLIEVMLAFSILSAVVVGAIIIMNQGIASAQNSLEITLVRNQMDTQAELLRHLNNGKLTSVGRASNTAAEQWDSVVALAGPSAQPYDEIRSVEDCRVQVGGVNRLPARAFFLDPRDGSVVTNKFFDVETFAQVQLNPDPSVPDEMISNMLWIEAVEGVDSAVGVSLNSTKYYDFHIRACWQSSGTDAGLMKLGTIVRLYAPED